MSPRSATKAELARLKDLATAATRRATGHCLVEGGTLLGEALAAGLAPALVACDDDALQRWGALLERAVGAGATLVSAPGDKLERIADRRHGQGLLAEVTIPVAGTPACVPCDGPALVVVLCGLQDPGNVGTLLRSALAFGASACLCLPGTADPWSPKVVRASAGACFGLPSARPDDERDLDEWVRPLRLVPCRAEPPGPAATGQRASDAAALPGRCLLLLGHETRGPAAVGTPVSVRQAPGVDSLNVAMAGSILMADWYRGQAR